MSADITVLRTDGTPQVIADAMEAVQDTSLPLEDRAALYGFLYELQRRVNRALGIRQKGPTAQYELTEHMTREHLDELGPLYIRWEAFDVAWPVNAEDAWTDPDIQDELGVLAPASSGYIKKVPQHFAVDTTALGKGVAVGDPIATQLHRICKDRRWRIEGGRRAALKVREVKTPSSGRVAA